MKRPSFRVFITRHHGGLVSAVLLRRFRNVFDDPPPAAMAEDEETALRRLAPQAALIVENDDDDDDLARYQWTEELELRRVDIDIHPGRPDPRGTVIAKATVPIKLGYAAAKLDGAPLYRVIVPRFDWSFVTEDLGAVPDTIRSLVFAALIGDSATSLYDLRREVDEQIIAWEPIEAAAAKDEEDEDAPDPAPTLETISEDWVALARAGRLPPTVGVDPVFDELMPALDDKHLPNLLLVGPRGSGKSTLVRRIARGLLERSRGKSGRRRRLWATSADRIVAGMIYLGMWQQRCLLIAHELSGGSDVLYVDRLADVLAPSSDGASIAELLAPAVIAGQLSLIAECDEAELVRARQRFPALVDAMRVVRVAEATPAQTIALLEPYGQRQVPPVAISSEGARRLVELLAAFRRDTAFPGKALAFLDYLATRPPRPAGRSGLAVAEVTETFGTWSGLPVELLAPERALDTAAIAKALQLGVIGQDHACTIAARVIARLKAGLDDPQRPVGALLFAGPTGVGKTELAKQLARYLFTDSERLVRVDMSELVTGAAIARLITPSPGGTSLADRIRRQPLSVVLFDEIEKADAAAFDLLLGVVGEGRLTDSLGRLVDFRMSVIVMTTNLGAADPKPAGFSSTPDDGADHLGVIRAFFRPELLGRIDSIIAFRPLAPPALEQIVDLELDKLRKRPGFVARNLRLEMTPGARTRLAILGHDPKLGARPLRRTIEDLVVAPIAERMARDPAWREATIRITATPDPGDVMV
ncbi:MAG: AAA family ATPase [Myxococcota bacterium]|nr:AAA family ATPase [Myxococcota bacterium]